MQLKNDGFAKNRSHTKITEDTKKNLNVFNRPFFVPSCEKLTYYVLIKNKSYEI